MEFKWVIKSTYPAPYYIHDLHPPHGLWVHPIKNDDPNPQAKYVELHKLFTIEQIQNSWGLKEAYQKKMVVDVEKVLPGDGNASLQVQELQNKIDALTNIIQNMASQPPVVVAPPVLTTQSVPNGMETMMQQMMNAITSLKEDKRGKRDLSVEQIALRNLDKIESVKESTFTSLGTAEPVQTGAESLAAQLADLPIQLEGSDEE
jgi:hypothetical protein